MPLEGEQLTYGWALALDYHVGWRGQDLITSVALMCAESARYTLAWHENYIGVPPDELQLVSTDWGIFQINDKAHPDLELPEGYRNVIVNAKYAHKLWKDHGWKFTPWAAYNSGAHLKFVPAVTAAWLLPRWRLKVANVEKKFA
jgi:hypothetical protein